MDPNGTSEPSKTLQDLRILFRTLEKNCSRPGTSENLTEHEKPVANRGTPHRNSQNLAEHHKTLWNLQELVERYTTMLFFFLSIVHSFETLQNLHRTLWHHQEPKRIWQNLIDPLRTTKNNRNSQNILEP